MPTDHDAAAAGVPDNTAGSVSLLLGIVSFPLAMLFGFGLLSGLAAIVFGAVGIGQVRQGHASNGAQAALGALIGLAAIIAIVAVYGPPIAHHMLHPTVAPD